MPGKQPKDVSDEDWWWSIVWWAIGVAIAVLVLKATWAALPGWVDQAATAFCQRWPVSTCGPAEGVYR